MHGGLVKWIAQYGTGAGTHVGLWSVPLTGGAPSQMSDAASGSQVQVILRFITDDDAGATPSVGKLYASAGNANLWHYPLDGSSPVNVAVGTDVAPCHARRATQLPYDDASDAYWIGADNSLTERRQALVRYDATAGRLFYSFNSAAAANFLGTFSTWRAWSVSLDRKTSAVFPWDAPPPTGVVLKLLQPLGNPSTSAGNTTADPRITLAAHENPITHVAHTPQFAFLYDFPNLW